MHSAHTFPAGRAERERSDQVLKPRRGAGRTAALALTLIVAAALTLPCLAGSKSDRPGDVILIVIDTLRPDALGCYGNPAPVSPRLDALAADGVRFTAAVSTSGWTLPAIASLMTATWPTLHGATGKSSEMYPIRENVPTGAERFRQAGYRTFGFANAAYVSPMLGFDRGFESYDHRHAFNEDIRRADETIDAALELIRAHREEPSFVFIHLFDPHLDYDPPATTRARFTAGREEPPAPLSWEDCVSLQRGRGTQPPATADIAYVKALYHAEVAFADEQIGRLVAELKSLGRYDAATLVVTADHGEEFWEHGGFEHGHTLYAELVDIPLIVKLPAEKKPARAVISSQVRIVDIMPTLLDLCGLEPFAQAAGSSLLPMMLGAEEPDRTAFCESTLRGKDCYVWSTGRYTYILNMGSGRGALPELFDRQADRAQTRNLASAQPEIASELNRALEEFRGGLREQARKLPARQPRDMSPREIESLRSLGYIR